MDAVRSLLCLVLLALGGVASAAVTFPDGAIRPDSTKASTLARDGGRYPVTVDRARLAAAAPGSTLLLPGSDGRPMVARFERFRRTAGDRWSWIGVVDTDLGPQSVVITVGGEHVFATIPQRRGQPLRLETVGGTTSLVADATPSAVFDPEVGDTRTPRIEGPQVFAPAALAGAVPPKYTPVPLVDVLVLYTAGMVSMWGSDAAVETRIAYLEALSNEAYLDSGAAIEIRVVATEWVDYPDATYIGDALDDLEYASTKPIKVRADQLRAQYGADLVTMLRRRDIPTNSGNCGLATIGGYHGAPFGRNQGFSVVADRSPDGQHCPDVAFTHELGHNMGGHHDYTTANGDYGAFSYSRGHKGSGFGTVMAYVGPGEVYVNRISTPLKSDCLAQGCGVADHADNARTFGQTAPLIAAYTNTVVPVEPKLYLDNATVAEGDSGTRNATFVVTLSRPAATDVVFDVVTVDGTATAGSDYTSLAATGVRIPAGQTTANLVVAVKGDTVDEATETFEVQVENVVGTKVGDGRAVGTIRNDDTTVSLLDQEVVEGDDGTKLMQFRVGLTVTSTNAVTFRFRTVDGTATAGSDYVARDLPAQSIAAGELEAVFGVVINGDLEVENDESFTVQLADVAGAKLPDGGATATIRNDDTSLSIDDVEVVEGDGGTTYARFTVTSLFPTMKPVSFDVATVDGGARAGSDYEPVNATVSLLLGATTHFVEVPVHGDTTVEPDEEFTVELANVAGALVTDGTGTGTILGDDDTATIIRTVLQNHAISNEPQGLAFDPATGDVYVATFYSHVVRRISAEGVVTVVAGRGVATSDGDGGAAAVAGLNHPRSLALDSEGNLFIGEEGRVRRVDRDDGTITTWAGNGGTDPNEVGGGDGGPARDAQLGGVSGLAFDAEDNLYLVSLGRIRRVSTAGIISTIAGANTSVPFGGDGGPAIHASLYAPTDVAVGPDGSLYISDTFNHRIRRVDPDGIIWTVAGTGDPSFGGDGGPAASARFSRPTGLSMDAAGNLYIVDSQNYRVRRIDRFGRIATVAGAAVDLSPVADGHPATSGRLTAPQDVAVGVPGEFFVAHQSAVRRIGPLGLPGAPVIGIASAGDGEAIVSFQPPADRGGSHITGYVVTTVSGGGTDVDAYTTAHAHRIAGLPNGTTVRFVVRAINEFGAGDESEPSNPVTPTASALPQMTLTGATVVEGASGGTLTFTVQLNRPVTDVVRFDAATADATATAGSDYTTTKINDRYIAVGATSHTFTVPYAGDTLAEPDEAFTVTLSDVLGATVVGATAEGRLVSDDFDALISTIAGDGGYTRVEGVPATESGMAAPRALAVDGAGNRYVVDYDRVMRIDGAGTTTTFAGGGTLPPAAGGLAVFAKFSGPTALATDAGGNVYVADAGVLLKITPAGLVDSVTGNGVSGVSCTFGLAPAGVARYVVYGMAFDGAGNLVMTDRCGVVRLTPWGALQRVAGGITTGFGGDDGPATAALFDQPRALTFDTDGDLLVGDSMNGRIRAITPGGVVRTLHTLPSPPANAHVRGLAVDAAGDIYYTTNAHAAVFKLGAEGTALRRIGTYSNGFSGDGGPAYLAQIAWGPGGLAVDRAGNVLVSDEGNRRVRRVGVIGTPDAPTIGTATAGNGEATIAFAAPAGDGGSPVVGYEVKSFPGGGVDGDAGGPSLVRVVGGLKNGTSYRFAARAINAAGPGPWSARSNAVVPVASALPTLAVGDVTLAEGDSGTRKARFPLTLSRPAPAGGVDVKLTTADVRAVAGSDYVARTATVTIPAGATAGEFAVTVLGDLAYEQNETFRAHVIAVTRARVPDGVAVATIANDDASTVSIENAEAVEGDEGTRAATFALRLSRVQPRDVLVDVETVSGTAVAGLDFVARRVVGLVIPAGALEAPFAVDVVGDPRAEGDERFAARIVRVVGGTALRAEAVGLIRDDDGVVPALSIADTEIVEGHDGTRTAVFRVTLSEPVAHEVSATWLTGEGNAAPGDDYVAKAPTRLSFAPGQTEAAVGVTVVGDTVPEAEEAFYVYLAAPSGATVARARAVGTIRDDEARLAIDDIVRLESSPAQQKIVVRVLGGPTVAPVRFSLASRDGTAVSSGATPDYVGVTANTQEIPAGATQFELPVPLQIGEDQAQEADETFELVFADVRGATVDTPVVRVTLLNDDPGGAQLFTELGTGNTTWVGEAPAGGNTNLNHPFGLAKDFEGNVYFIESTGQRVRRLSPDGSTTTVAGNGTQGFSGDFGPATEAQLQYATGLAIDDTGNIYIADSGNDRIRRVWPDGTITTIAGNGTRLDGPDGGLGIETPLQLPRDVALLPDGRLLITTAARVRVLDNDGRLRGFAGTTSGYSGDGGPALDAKFGETRGITVAADGKIYVADYGNWVVRRIDPDGTIHTHIGNNQSGWRGGIGGREAYYLPIAGRNYGIGRAADVAIAGDGTLYIAADHRVLQMTPSGVVFPLAGNGYARYDNDGSPASYYSLNSPSGLLLDGDDLYVADTANHRLRRVSVSRIAGAPEVATAEAGNASATVTFLPPSVPGSHPILEYEVISQPAGGIDQSAGTADVRRTITGLQNGTSYTFVVRARTAAGTGAASLPTNAVVPFDPDQPVLSVGPVTVDEGDTGNRTAVFDLKLSKGSLQPVRFAASTAALTATAGSDYIALNLPEVVIPAGHPGTRIAVVIRGDAQVEPDETFKLRITDVVGATLEPGNIVGTIRNDDQLKLSVADVTVAEGDAGTTTATFSVRLSQPATADVKYSIATSDGTATSAADYVARALTGQTIAAGAISKVFAVTIAGDTAVEADETFTVDVTGVTGAVIADGHATGTITNDDEAPPPALAIDDVVITEGDSGTRNAKFTVRLSAPAPAPVTFAIKTVDGTATAGSDYVARSQAGRTIAAGASTYDFVVTVNGDGVVEPNETFLVKVNGVAGATVADGTAIGTIADDDATLPVLATRDDRVVLRENAAASAIAVLANDVLTASRLAGGSLAVLSTDVGTATVDTRGTATAADDRIRYTPAPDTSGSARIAYRICETDGRCADGTLAVEVRPAVDVLQATPSGAGFVDITMSGLRPLPAASFAATPLVAPTVTARTLATDTTVETPWDLALAGTSVVTGTLPVPVDGLPAPWRLLFDAAGTGDVDLYVGVDTNGDGAAAAGELRCVAAMTSGRERCELALTHPGTGAVRWWALLHNRGTTTQTATLETFAVPMTAPTAAFAATGPGALPRGVPFAARAAFVDHELLPGDARAGYVRIRSGGVDRGVVPVRLDRTDSQAPATRLTDQPLALKLAAGSAQDRLFVDVPAGATSLTVTTASGQNVDLYLARAATPSSPRIDAAPARSAAVASATGATGNESLTVSGGALQPGRWYVTPVNAGGTAAWVSVKATIAGTGPVLRFGSFFNPARGGHGIFVYPAGGDWAGLWYTYLQDGTPTWYYVQGAKPGADGIFTGGLYRAAWQGTANLLTQVGDVRITPTSADGFDFSYRLDGETGSEPMASLGRGCPTLDGLPLDVSSHWFNPAKAGTGYSVQLWPTYEYYAAFVYDAHGVPRFLTAERNGFGGAEATLDLEQLTGFCPLCDRPGNPVRQTIGVFSRRFGGGTIQNLSVDGIYAGGIPGAWTADEAVQTLGGPGTTQSCAP